jgi:hypothetical protein
VLPGPQVGFPPATTAPGAVAPQSVPLPVVPAPAGTGTRTEAARVASARARVRGVPQPDVVTFVARCPGCGRDAEWQEEREDTRLRATVRCDCA